MSERRKTFFVYLKSGQVIAIKAKGMEVEWSKSTGECSSWHFTGVSTRTPMPVWIQPSQIVAVTQKGM